MDTKPDLRLEMTATRRQMMDAQQHAQSNLGILALAGRALQEILARNQLIRVRLDIPAQVDRVLQLVIALK